MVYICITENDLQLDFNGPYFKWVLQLALKSDPTSPMFMGIFQKVTKTNGSESFAKIRWCGFHSISWVSLNVSITLNSFDLYV
jgi:hypothetical protein